MSILKINRIGYSQVDSNTKLLLHCDGADESTTLTDATGNHTVTANGNVELDTAQKKWGTASCKFDGISDNFTIPTSSDFEWFASTTESWNIDFQMKFNNISSPATTQNIFYSRVDVNNFFQLFHDSTNGFRLLCRSGGSYVIDSGSAGTLSDTNWHHICFVHLNDIFSIYVDGVQTHYLQDTSTKTYGSTIYFGSTNSGSSGYNGWLDEIRVQKSNSFGANPVVGLTDTITVPTSAYANIGLGKFQKIALSSISKINRILV